MEPKGDPNPNGDFQPPPPLGIFLGEGEKAVEGNLSVCGSIMVPVEGTGLLPLIFFLSPSPSQIFPEV